jgi:F420-dependent oxidoreductase-like protein
LEIALMVEGQDGLTWNRWRGLLEAAESLGFAAVFRSDHFTNARPPDKPSLELWASLTYAAGNTKRIEFGSLVTPVTFRHPAITARAAAAADDLSGGRLVLGIGAGWQEREHHVFGVPFPPTDTRFHMLEEYVQVVKMLLRSDGPSTFQGRFYQLNEAVLLPRPARHGGPQILIGGNGERRTLPLAAKHADQWNALFAPPDRVRALHARFDECLDQVGRPRNAVKRSIMVGTLFARDDADLSAKLAGRAGSAGELAQRGLVVGTAPMWVDQLHAYAEAGIQRIMLQWLDQDDLQGLEIVARDVLPQFTAPSTA